MKEVEEAAEKELIREFKEGRTEVFDVLVRQYTPVLYRFACGLLENRDDAEEVVQDAFIRAYKALPAFRGDSSFSTWMHRITMNLARNKFHYNKCRGLGLNVSLTDLDSSAAHTKEGKNPEYELPDINASPDKVLERAEIEKNVLSGLHGLPECLREAMILRHVDNMPYDRIASVLDCKIGTVKSRLARGRELLKDFLLRTDLPAGESGIPAFSNTVENSRREKTVNP